MGKRIWVPLPDRDFDTTEVSVPWRLLREAGVEVVFATEKGGKPPATDPLLLQGVVFGKLGADPEAASFYAELERAPEFQRPLSWSEIRPSEYDALLLPGGHAPGMRQYLGSEVLRQKVLEFWKLGRPVGAICHGVLVLARTLDPSTGRSVLYERRTTCLPGYMERLAYFLTFWLRGRYYRTYPLYVEAEVKAALRDPATQFERGPLELGARGTRNDDAHSFVVKDGSYLSARWPGDAYRFARELLALLGISPSS